MIVGSLIKNPGGGLAPIGGYIVGKQECVDNAACRLTSPGLGQEVGASLACLQSFYQGLFLAPTVVSGRLKGRDLRGQYLRDVWDFPWFPNATEPRYDIIQAVTFGKPEGRDRLLSGNSGSGPGGQLRGSGSLGYAGIRRSGHHGGGSLCPGFLHRIERRRTPASPPYTAYFQGGLTWYHAKLGILCSLQKLCDANLVKATDLC